MKKFRLGDLLTVKHGWAFKGEFFAESGQMSILTPGNFFDKGGFKRNDERERYYTGEFPSEYLSHKSDLIVAMTEQATGLLGSTAIVPEDDRYLHNQRIGLITCNENIDKMFAYYLFMTRSVREQISRTSSGTKVKHTSPEKIYDVEVIIPDISMQKKIAHILWSIDMKIECNTHINDNLQQMAKDIYNYWFTQFDFPDENGNPYRSSGGKMVWNDKLKIEIPCGWEYNQLKSVCNLYLGGTPDTTNQSYWNGSINWLNSGEISQLPVVSSELRITEEGLHNSSTKLMKKGTSVVSITGNIRASILAIDTCANQSVVGIEETSQIKHPYLYPYLCNQLDYYTAMSTGNCQKHINKGMLEETLLLIPPKAILDRFYEISLPIYEKITENALESTKLSDLRDWLLPMLMNGQVTIAD